MAGALGGRGGYGTAADPRRAARVPGAGRRHPRADLGRRRRRPHAGQPRLAGVHRRRARRRPRRRLAGPHPPRRPERYTAIRTAARSPRGAVRAGVPATPRGRPLPLGARPRRPVRRRRYVGGCLDIDDRHRERERRRLLAAIGAAMDAETTWPRAARCSCARWWTRGSSTCTRLVDIARARRGPSPWPRRAPRTSRSCWALDPPRGARPEPVTAGVAQLFTVDEAYILASSADERQRELRRALGPRTVVVVPLSARGRLVGCWPSRAAGRPPRSRTTTPRCSASSASAPRWPWTTRCCWGASRPTGRRLEVLQRATAALSAAASPRAVARTAVHRSASCSAPSRGGRQRRDDTLVLLDAGGLGARRARQWARIPSTARTPVTDTARDGEPAGRHPRRGAARLPAARKWQPRSGHRLPAPADVPAGRRARAVGVVGLGRRRGDLPADDRAAPTCSPSSARRRCSGPGCSPRSRSRAAPRKDFGRGVGAVRRDPPRGRRRDHPARVGAGRVRRRGRAARGRAAGGAGGPPGAAAGRAEHPLARAVRTGHPVWPGKPSPSRRPAVRRRRPVLLEGRAIGAIGLAFGRSGPRMGPSQRAIIRTVAGQCAQALDRARLHQAEHEVADVLQRSLLPRRAAAAAPAGRGGRALPARRRRHRRRAATGTT